jgi:hypothetical protein
MKAASYCVNISLNYFNISIPPQGYSILGRFVTVSVLTTLTTSSSWTQVHDLFRNPAVHRLQDVLRPVMDIYAWYSSSKGSIFSVSKIYFLLLSATLHPAVHLAFQNLFLSRCHVVSVPKLGCYDRGRKGFLF